MHDPSITADGGSVDDAATVGGSRPAATDEDRRELAATAPQRQIVGRAPSQARISAVSR
jgi:hypothetical protein